MTPSETSAFKAAMSGSQLRRSLIVMIIVGTALNLINQGDALIEGGALDISKIVLTYCMPFLVVSFGAWSALQKEIQSRKQSQNS